MREIALIGKWAVPEAPLDEVDAHFGFDLGKALRVVLEILRCGRTGREHGTTRADDARRLSAGRGSHGMHRPFGVGRSPSVADGTNTATRGKLRLGCRPVRRILADVYQAVGVRKGRKNRGVGVCRAWRIVSGAAGAVRTCSTGVCDGDGGDGSRVSLSTRRINAQNSSGVIVAGSIVQGRKSVRCTSVALALIIKSGKIIMSSEVFIFLNRITIETILR